MTAEEDKATLRATHPPPAHWAPEKPIFVPFVDLWARIHDARHGKWCVQIVPAPPESPPAPDDPRWGIIESDLADLFDSFEEARIWLTGFLLCGELIENARRTEEAEQAALLKKLDDACKER